MVNWIDNNQNGFLFERLERSLSQRICVLRDDLEVFFESIRRICVDEIDSILQLQTGLGEITPIESPIDCATAKRIGEFLVKRI